MPTTTLGPGGPVVSRIGLGLAALGRPGLHHRLAAPATCPTAAWPGCGPSPSPCWTALTPPGSVRRRGPFLRPGRGVPGRWLTARDHPDVVVGSKWGYRYVGDWRWTRTSTRSRSTRWPCSPPSWPRAGPCSGTGSRCTRCTRPRWTRACSTTRPAGRPGRAAGARCAGRADHQRARPGRHPPPRAAVSVDGQPVFGAAQVTWNLLEPSVGPAAAEAAAAGWPILVKEAVANGRLAPGRAPPALTDWPPARASPRTRWRWPPRWPALGHRGPVRRGDPGPAPVRTWTRSRSAPFLPAASWIWPSRRRSTGRPGPPGR